MSIKLCKIDKLADLETGRAMQAMTRLKIALAIGIKKGFGEIHECNHCDCVIPAGTNTGKPFTSMPMRCASLFYAERRLIRIFEDVLGNSYYSLVKHENGKIEGCTHSHVEANALVRDALASKYPSDPILLKNIAMLQLLEELSSGSNN